MNRARYIRRPQGVELSRRRCHDCGRSTTDYRCPSCRRKWALKHGVSLEELGLAETGSDSAA